MGGGNLRNSHDAPLTSCQCGIYAWDTAKRGKVFRHTYGYRAEYAKPVALVAPSGASRPLLEALARSYRLDLLLSIEAA
jgi:hypothetical protein